MFAIHLERSEGGGGGGGVQVQDAEAAQGESGGNVELW